MNKTANNYFISYIDVLGFSKFFDIKEPDIIKIYNSIRRIIVDLKELNLTGEPNTSYVIVLRNINRPNTS